jgi:hypothetical protein
LSNLSALWSNLWRLLSASDFFWITLLVSWSIITLVWIVVWSNLSSNPLMTACICLFNGH